MADSFALADDERRTDTRCGVCGEWLVARESRAGGGWDLSCGCGNGARVYSTSWTWIQMEFCSPFHGEGSHAPLVAKDGTMTARA